MARLRHTGVPSLISSPKPVFKGIRTRNTYYIRLGEGLCLASHLKATTTSFLRVVYGAKCSTDFCYYEVLCKKEEVSCIHEYIA